MVESPSTGSRHAGSAFFCVSASARDAATCAQEAQRSGSPRRRCGKTRLALQASAEVADEFPGGVF